MDKNQKLTRIKDGMYVGNHAVIVTDQRTTEPVNFRQTDDKGRDVPLGNKDWIEWGVRDNYPDEIEDLNSQEPVSSRCLDFKSKAFVGQGLFWYRKRFENDKEFHEHVDMNAPEMTPIREFCENSNIDQVLRDMSLDVAWWDMCYAEMILNIQQTKIISMSRLDAAYCRMAPKDLKGYMPWVHVSSKFGQLRPLDKDIDSIHTMKDSDPFRYPKAVYRSVRNSSRRMYYPKASWHSTFGALDLALEAFQWIRSNLKNSKNIKYLIKVPWNYFLSRFRIEDYTNREEWIAAIKADEERLYKEMDDVLAGSENAMKAFRTKYGTDEEGNPIEEFKIEQLTVDTQHEAWLPLYDTTAAAICSGHGVAPPLASIQVSSSMGASHGSTIREMFNFYIQFETTIPRQVILEPLLFVKRANKWPADIYPGFRNVILETLDNNKSGVRNEGEGNPTTTNKNS
jgi:hypothetical protein